MFYYGYDMTYLIFVLPAMLIAMWAQMNVTSTFKKYSRTPSDRGLTGRDAARRILDGAGLHHVQVVPTEGELTDHFDPKENVIRLSTPVYNVASAAAVGVAAHATAVTEQEDQNDDPANVTTAETVIVTHKNYLRNFISGTGRSFQDIPAEEFGAK